MITVLFTYLARAQERKGFEEYYYPGTAGVLPSLSTKAFYENRENWYTEVRYNYEEENTIACSIGRTFFKEDSLSYSFTPVAGLVAGRQQGLSTAQPTVQTGALRSTVTTLRQDVGR